MAEQILCIRVTPAIQKKVSPHVASSPLSNRIPPYVQSDSIGRNSNLEKKPIDRINSLETKSHWLP